VAARPYTLYRTTRVAPAVRGGAVLALVVLALGPVAVTALAVGGREPSRVAAAEAASTPRQAALTAARRTPVVEIAAVGDVALGHAGSLPADPGSLFAGVRGALHGDVVLGNLESALSDDGSAKCDAGASGCFSFVVPPAAARSLRSAGFTVMSVANNHTRDAGESGLAETAAALEAAGVATTGRAAEIAIVRTRGTRVAVLGFAPYSWASDLLDLDAAAQLVRSAAAKADLVVVNMHAGAEGTAQAHVRPGAEWYLGERRGDPVAFAHAVIDAGADLVIGHGPHVLRALEWYRGRLIAYSLGNFSSHRNFDLTGPLGTSAVLRVRLHADGTWAGGRVVPVRLEGTGSPAPDPARTALTQLRELSRDDVGPRALRIGADGALTTPA
jgi:poly-gamma-glutamate capsule biosynthesis protein CapA/YwtB (metallophosphatase superfamily)